jgi:hypothetical protein
MADNRRSGINPQAYMGVEASSPPQFVYFRRDPTSEDYYNWRIGTIWLNRSTTPQNVWMLVDLKTSPHPTATWIKFNFGLVVAALYQTQNLVAVPDAGGTLEVYGAGVLNTDALTVNRVTVNITNGAAGEILLGGGADAHWGPIISSDGSITITPGPANIDLIVSGGIGASEFHADDWPPNFAIPALGVINILGDGLAPQNIYTSAAGNTVRVNLANDIHITGTLLADEWVQGGNIRIGEDPSALNLNTISSTNLNGDIVIQPDGTGNTIINSVVKGADTFIMDSNGYRIMPYQCCFSYSQSIDILAVTGDGTWYTGSFNTMQFDQNSNFVGTTTFVAPKTGIYYFDGQFFLGNMGGLGVWDRWTSIQTRFVTTTMTYTQNLMTPIRLIYNPTIPDGTLSIFGETMAHMNQGDSCYFQVQVSGFDKRIRIIGGSSIATNFSGYLVC